MVHDLGPVLDQQYLGNLDRYLSAINLFLICSYMLLVTDLYYSFL